MLSQTSRLAVIVSVEGAGKSTSLIRQAGAFRLEDQIENFFMGNGLIDPCNGHQIVSCKSYAQAEEQYESYTEWRNQSLADPSKLNPPAPLLIMSFSETYGRYCSDAGIDPVSHMDALGMGFDSQVEAVLNQQPDVFATISDIRNAAWQHVDDIGNVIDGFSDVTNVLVFTVHSMAHSYNRVSKSKAWLNPAFTNAALANNDAWIALATEFQAYRVIHDELSISDLVHIAHDDDVRLANQFKATVLATFDDPWSNIKQSQRLKEFVSCACDDMWEIGFHRINELADLNFGPGDVFNVDYNAIPFGVAHKADALYLRSHGQVVYLRSKTWWTDLKSRVVFTTTEALPAGVAAAIFASSTPRCGRVVRWDGDQFFPRDPVQLKIDDRANKKNIAELATDVLSDPTRPADVVIADMVKGVDIMSHVSARGSNGLRDKHLATTLTSIGEREYMELNVIAQAYRIDDVITAFYIDRYNQAVGRNRGLRGDTLNPMRHDVYVTQRLLRGLGGIATFQKSRYPAFLVP